MNTDTRILAELFTSTHLRELAWYGWTQTLLASVDILKHRGKVSQNSSVASVFETAFAILYREYPIEYVYKSRILKETIFGTKDSPETAALYVEFPVMDARADMLLVNGTATVFEIKTQFDSPKRLETQLEEYYRCFKSVCVIVKESQTEYYLQQLPEHVGVRTLTSHYSTDIQRASMEAPGQLDHTHMFALLRQKERQHVASDFGINLLDIAPLIRYQTALEYFKILPVDDAYDLVLLALRNRQNTVKLATLCDQLPNSLYTGAFSYRIRKRDWNSLIELFSRPLHTLQEPSPNVFPVFERKAK